MQQLSPEERWKLAGQEYSRFLDDFQSLILATTNKDGTPNASYAPFVQDENRNFYVQVSGLAKHTPNLYHTGKASILFLQDESGAEQIFARRRLTYNCTVELLEDQDPIRETILDRFEERFGQIAAMLRKMPDFRMFRLTPRDGLLVLGFGAAYPITGDLTELDPPNPPMRSDDVTSGAHTVKRELN